MSKSNNNEKNNQRMITQWNQGSNQSSNAMTNNVELSTISKLFPSRTTNTIQSKERFNWRKWKKTAHVCNPLIIIHPLILKYW